MIQRIQSIWLFLASMVSGLLFMSSIVLFKWAAPVTPTSPIVQMQSLTARQDYPLLIIAGFMTILPLIAIFFFRDRARQRGLATLSILASVAFAVVLFMKISGVQSSGAKVEYGALGALIPVASIVFLILAIRGIRKDEKVLKSLDRLR